MQGVDLGVKLKEEAIRENKSLKLMMKITQIERDRKILKMKLFRKV